MLEVLECRRRHQFLHTVARHCDIVALRAYDLFVATKCPIHLQVPVVDLAYDSHRRSDLPLLSTFRDMVLKKFKAHDNHFLTFPPEDEPFDAEKTMVTPE
ncbi:hypothetical protein A2U01_0034443, partial [Trifolium medium]|nr:hypothetical protein [Trifolium medium]